MQQTTFGDEKQLVYQIVISRALVFGESVFLEKTQIKHKRLTHALYGVCA